MGEAERRKALGLGPKTLQPGTKITVDLKNATPNVCECGCKYFMSVVTSYTISALLSPTGQELSFQVPVLLCVECKKQLK